MDRVGVTLTVELIREAARKAKAAADAIPCERCKLAGVTNDPEAVITFTRQGNYWLHGKCRERP